MLILRHYKPPKHDPARDSAYLTWIRQQSCLICRLFRYVEAAHVGIRGLSQKCPDRQTVPLCPAHHRTGPHSHHTLGKKFWSFWKLNRNDVIAELNRRYENERN